MEDPLAVLFGGQATPAEARSRALKVEDRTASCMRALGWEYTPVDPGVDQSAVELSALNPREFGLKWGYGIIFGWQNRSSSSESPDPNSGYTASLSEGELEAYFEDLNGVAGDDGSAEQGDNEGCRNKAMQEVGQDSPITDTEVLFRFNELYTQRVLQNPEYISTTAEWSDCMASTDDSYDFKSQLGILVRVSREVRSLMGQEIVRLEAGATLAEAESFEVDDYGVTWAYVGQQSEISESDWSALLRLEISLWEADQKCMETSNLGSVQNRLRADVLTTLRNEFPSLD